MRLLCLILIALVSAPVAAADAYRAYVEGPLGQIHVRVDGPAEGPTVIPVHKMVWSSIEFAKTQPYLARRGVRTIAAGAVADFLSALR